MNHKLLIISGPTATGKTILAIRLAKKYNGEIISADSRQIYKGMDIGTGKDHPHDVKIHLVDIIKPSQSFSSAEFRQLALNKIIKIQSKNKLPIIVGGTGHYIDALINPKTTFSIKPNNFLRYFLNKFPIFLLQKIYFVLDKNSYQKLNNSDVHNPHRLIRKIEIKLCNNSRITDYGLRITDYLHLSLTAPNKYIFDNIDRRIQSRLDMGLLLEIKNLLKTYKWSDPGLNCLAYKDFKNYFENKLSLEKSIELWRFAEHSYARRQKTWFKKISPIHFIDISVASYSKKVTAKINQWYNKL